MLRKAILQVADTGPLESLVMMLHSVGIQCYLPSPQLKSTLRQIGCDTVLDVENLVSGMGYEQPMKLPIAQVSDMEHADLYVDIKAHRCYDKVVKRWPNLANKVLWYRINGGKPEHVINERGDHGDEVNPPCPVLTPNQWYKGWTLTDPSDPNSYGRSVDFHRAYVCWPPFFRFHQYRGRRRYENAADYDRPLCLLHNAGAWGYERLVEPFAREFGLRVFGVGSPDGLIPHAEAREYLASALCMIHLKSSDAPGYALYEALAAGCPVICTRRLIWRCQMQDLLIPNETCLVFDRESHEHLNDQDVKECLAEVRQHVETLNNPEDNWALGQAGRKRLQQVMWDGNREADLNSLKEFFWRCF